MAITIYGIRNCDTMMLAQPSLIKRPMLDVGGRLVVGFKPETYDSAVRTSR